MDASKARNDEVIVSATSRGKFAQARYDASRRWSRLNVHGARDEILDQKAAGPCRDLSTEHRVVHWHRGKPR